MNETPQQEVKVEPVGPSRPKFVSYVNDEGCKQYLVTQFISGIMVSMGDDNVSLAVVILASGGPNIIVPCGTKLEVANKLADRVRQLVASDLPFSPLAMNLNGELARIVEQAGPELLIAETVVPH